MQYPTSQLKVLQYAGLQPGVRLIVLGAVHGNETCGTRAIERITREIDAGELAIVRGSVSFVPVTNPLAYASGHRAGDRNLNRNLRVTATPQDFEDHIANRLCPLLDAHDVLLDLHSFHTPGEAFAMLGPQDNDGPLEPFARATQEEAFALRLGVRRIVEGWLDTYARGVAHRVARAEAQTHAAGSGADNASADNPAARQQQLNTDPAYGVGTTEYMRSRGGCAITLECGQHEDPAAPDLAWRAIRNTLAHFRLIDAPDPAPVAQPEVLRLHEVIDRLHPGDSFVREWKSFDKVAAGERIGTRHDGTPVVAEEAGYVVFPNPGALAGQEWFYLARVSGRFAD
ncbi:succinylglutamate desuccinylase/aspartoacylase domain-containing protein [Uliginosibacterium sp. H1]|uniref:succinylglutamate desuccinylase/aspartoacylase domain-containing protein n=1 Tax=Uliginosibacterium sp. H1 TaxID=3114757 RepID=UPI002E1868FE|nr:succinylglutamate desuccinylase/aspartoacylase family protein [Uliginosibacterium sp. H1]